MSDGILLHNNLQDVIALKVKFVYYDLVVSTIVVCKQVIYRYLYQFIYVLCLKRYNNVHCK